MRSKAQSMLANLPRWFLVGLTVIAVGAVFLLVFPGRLQLPEECQEGDRALQEGDPDLAIERYIHCIQSAELPTRILAHVFFNLGDAYSAKGNHRQAIDDYSEALRLDPEVSLISQLSCSGVWLRQVLSNLDDRRRSSVLRTPPRSPSSRTRPSIVLPWSANRLQPPGERSERQRGRNSRS